MCSQEPSVLKSWPQKTDSEDSKTQVFIKGEWLKKNEKGRIVMKSRKDRKQRHKWTKVRKVLLGKNKNGEQGWETSIAHIRFISRCPSYYSNLWEGSKHSYSHFPSFLSLVFMPPQHWNVISEISMPAMDCLLEPSLVPNYHRTIEADRCNPYMLYYVHVLFLNKHGGQCPGGKWSTMGAFPSSLLPQQNEGISFLLGTFTSLLFLMWVRWKSSYPWLFSLPLFHRSIQSDILAVTCLLVQRKY